MDTEIIKKKIQSPQFRKTLMCVSIGVITLLVFETGMQVGYMKASYSYKYGDSYYRSFGPESGRGMGMPGTVSDAHGVSGKIVSINLATLVVADQDNTEKIVVLDPETVIREDRNTITLANLQIGQFIVVIGEPNATAQIDAKFIRVLPQPMMAPQTPITQSQPATGAASPK